METSLKQYTKIIAGARRPLLPLVLVLLLAFTAPVQASPQMPCQLYGEVRVNGESAPAGTPITASINEVTYFSSTVNANGVYGYSPDFFRIPGDDPETPEIEGGVNGDTVELFVSGITAGTGTFSSGEVLNINLSITAGGSNLQPSIPGAPTGFFASATVFSIINLTWTDNSNNEDEFWISRSTDGASYYVIARLPANSTSYTDTPVSGDTLYYYFIQARNNAGGSAFAGITILSADEPSPPPEEPEPGAVPPVTPGPVPDQIIVPAPAPPATPAPQPVPAPSANPVEDPRQETSEIKTSNDITQVPDDGQKDNYAMISATPETGITQTIPKVLIETSPLDTEPAGPIIFGKQLPDWDYPLIGVSAAAILAIISLLFIIFRQNHH